MKLLDFLGRTMNCNMINRNMRCIEIALIAKEMRKANEINRNMRCIEMKVVQKDTTKVERLIET